MQIRMRKCAAITRNRKRPYVCLSVCLLVWPICKHTCCLLPSLVATALFRGEPPLPVFVIAQARASIIQANECEKFCHRPTMMIERSMGAKELSTWSYPGECKRELTTTTTIGLLRDGAKWRPKPGISCICSISWPFLMMRSQFAWPAPARVLRDSVWCAIRWRCNITHCQSPYWPNLASHEY